MNYYLPELEKKIGDNQRRWCALSWTENGITVQRNEDGRKWLWGKRDALIFQAEICSQGSLRPHGDCSHLERILPAARGITPCVKAHKRKKWPWSPKSVWCTFSKLSILSPLHPSYCKVDPFPCILK